MTPRRYLHEKLYEFLQKASRRIGSSRGRAAAARTVGDGALVVIPPDIPGKGIIDPFPERLAAPSSAADNHVSSEAARLQLRVAAHIGPVEHDGYGFVGTDVNLLFRMLEGTAAQALPSRIPVPNWPWSSPTLRVRQPSPVRQPAPASGCLRNLSSHIPGAIAPGPTCPAQR